MPLVLLPRLDADGFDWQVPGLRDELITALLRTLPKVLRRQVVPAADWAAKISAELPERARSAAPAREPFAAIARAGDPAPHVRARRPRATSTSSGSRRTCG